jgi:predicted RNase H-like nuclease (RuvC/YqgF family)
MISSITGFERFAVAQDKEIKRLQALVNEQAEQIDSLHKTVEHLTELSFKYADELIRLRRAITDELSITRAAQIFNDGFFKQRGVV